MLPDIALTWTESSATGSQRPNHQLTSLTTIIFTIVAHNIGYLSIVQTSTTYINNGGDCGKWAIHLLEGHSWAEVCAIDRHKIKSMTMPPGIHIHRPLVSDYRVITLDYQRILHILVISLRVTSLPESVILGNVVCTLWGNIV